MRGVISGALKKKLGIVGRREEERERRAALPLGGVAVQMSKTKQPAVNQHDGDGHGDPVVIAASMPGRSAPASPGSLKSAQPKIGSLEHESSGDRRTHPTHPAGGVDRSVPPPTPKGHQPPSAPVCLGIRRAGQGPWRLATRHPPQAASGRPGRASTGATTRRRERRGALSPGSRLVREWQGRIHTVEVTDCGFDYAGHQYRSLSEVARTITGRALVRAEVLRTMTIQRRCAIYTRKSTEEGLEQDFNSLHAQREACEAFIKSQRHEGWRLFAEKFDDGGYSGGTMERPALNASPGRRPGRQDRTSSWSTRSTG